jgi:hypothetical protein
MEQRDHHDLWNEPLEVQVHEGAVIVMGPRGVAIALTTKAAGETAELLTVAAVKAKRPQES